MKFEIEQDDNVTIMTLKGSKLDTKIAAELKSQFILLSKAGESGHLILDLSSVNFADSSGLSALLLAHRLYRDADRKLILCNMTDRVNKLLEISQLTSVFTISSDKASALEHIDATA
ncbi:MAG: STAS domain-containing protein [Cyclonatronaceae bacterium]